MYSADFSCKWCLQRGRSIAVLLMVQGVGVSLRVVRQGKQAVVLAVTAALPVPMCESSGHSSVRATTYLDWPLIEVRAWPEGLVHVRQLSYSHSTRANSYKPFGVWRPAGQASGTICMQPYI